MHKIRYIMVGGFLGAGKTTTLAQLARRYTQAGLRVGIVTNDQATDLVDTNTLRSQGFDVGEVAGACFCCHFNELVDTLGSLKEIEGCEPPDVILAEPVGSCTDLVATVIQPLKKLYEAEFSIAPYCVILKPSHGKRILGGGTGGFSPKAAYILEKQLEEADAVLLNRIDDLTADEADQIAALVAEKFPDTPLLRVSARTGDGFDAVEDFLSQDGDFGRKILDIDYDIYAEGEAELGWLNASGSWTGDREFDLDALLVEAIEELKTRIEADGAEPAHLKAIGLWEGFYGVANLISSDTPVELSLPSRCRAKEVEVIVNARVAIDPAVLAEHVTAVMHRVAANHGIAYEPRQSQSFRPGRPVPVHRETVPV